jgi:hypothetical protein
LSKGALTARPPIEMPTTPFVHTVSGSVSEAFAFKVSSQDPSTVPLPNPVEPRQQFAHNLKQQRLRRGLSENHSATPPASTTPRSLSWNAPSATHASPPSSGSPARSRSRAPNSSTRSTRHASASPAGGSLDLHVLVAHHQDEDSDRGARCDEHERSVRPAARFPRQGMRVDHGHQQRGRENSRRNQTR